MFILRVGWLTDLTQWLWDLITKMFLALADFVSDIFVSFCDFCFSLILFVVGVLPWPDFLKQQTIGDMLGQAGSTVVWFADVFQLSNSMRVISAAIVFSIFRRLLTLGIW